MLIEKQYKQYKEAANTTIFFIFEKVKETVLDFSQGLVKV